MAALSLPVIKQQERRTKLPKKKHLYQLIIHNNNLLEENKNKYIAARSNRLKSLS